MPVAGQLVEVAGMGTVPPVGELPEEAVAVATGVLLLEAVGELCATVVGVLLAPGAAVPPEPQAARTQSRLASDKSR